MKTKIASIALGWSNWNDEVWEWLTRHRDLFFTDGLIPDFNSYDYINAIGIMMLCGCVVEVSRDHGDAQFSVWFSGSPALLVKRLNRETGRCVDIR